MISKIIHYCWYGNGKKDALSERCINSWKKYCYDYQIIEWNEKNCDVYSTAWTKEAYENRKWAFVSVYFRLKAMYEYGGIYMDTDVELFKNLDSFLGNDAFAAVLTEFIENPEKYAECGKRAERYFDENFERSVVINQIEGYLETLAGVL